MSKKLIIGLLLDLDGRADIYKCIVSQIFKVSINLTQNPEVVLNENDFYKQTCYEPVTYLT